jgi:hypothetical protein
MSAEAENAANREFIARLERDDPYLPRFPEDAWMWDEEDLQEFFDTDGQHRPSNPNPRSLTISTLAAVPAVSAPAAPPAAPHSLDVDGI